MRCFLDVDIGDQAQYAQELEAYNRAKAFLAAVGSQYGWPSNLEQLDAGGCAAAGLWQVVAKCGADIGVALACALS